MDERAKKIYESFGEQPHGKVIIISRADFDLVISLFCLGFIVVVSDRDQGKLDNLARDMIQMTDSVERFRTRSHFDDHIEPHDMFICGDLDAPHPAKHVVLK